MAPARSASAALAFLSAREDIDERTQEGFRYLVHNSSSFEQDAPSTDSFRTDWRHSYSVLGIQASKQHDEDGRVYRVRGCTRMPCDKEVSRG